MSLPNSVSAPIEKQRTNIFTMMLMLSFIALVTGCVIFSLEWQRFEGEAPWNTSSVQPKPPAPRSLIGRTKPCFVGQSMASTAAAF